MSNVIELLLFFGLLAATAPLLGKWMATVFEGRPTFLSPVLGWLEGLTYQIAKIDPAFEMGWYSYAKALMLFNACGFLLIFLLQIFQYFLPLNPQNFPGVPWLLAFNTAASFVTNTNWQAYAGETTLSYTTQMLGLAVQNFLSAATGMCVILALVRGIKRKSSQTLGNVWADYVRTIVYLLLPLSIILALALVSQGVVQTFSPYVEVITVEGNKQTIPLGPAASQIAIKQLGSNGGGFFNTNSSHPFENPTPLSNFLETFAILLIPASIVFMYGCLVDEKRHAWLLFLVMLFFCFFGLGISFYGEKLHLSLEGIETRFAIPKTLLWSVSTTVTSNGSVNGMLDSLSPLAGGVALFNIMLGEQIFGGVGVGLCSMIMFVLLTVFLAGLMVGRTPEYIGKKIEKRDIQWAMLAILSPSACILLGSGIASALPTALASLRNKGPHGLSELLYAFSSASGNNGSAFAGLNADTPFFNLTLGLIMLITRLAIVIPSLAIAGNLAAKKVTPPTIGTFSTDNLLFAILLVSVIFIVGALTFFPPLALGPIVEHFLMLKNLGF
jgi:K+-transporting ATPase ATPase A chain